jgi:branched-chain amino acid transport system ATP-binding protein
MPLLLEVDDLATGYGKVQVVRDLTLSVPAGKVVALLGPNGAGKTTTLKAISGTLPAWRGSVHFDGRRIDGLPPYRIARAGLTLVPEGRGIFPSLSVRDNLEVATRAAQGATAADRAAELERVLTIFPRLRERLDQTAGTLSGGEQQMLAMSRAFAARPTLLMVDEISMGLAPLIVEQLFEGIATLRDDGLTIVLVEQYFTYALRLADVCYVLAKGTVAFVGEADELRGSSVLASSYLGD